MRTTQRIDASLAASGARIGQYVVLDPIGRVVRITDFIASWAAMTYQRTAHGFERVA